MRKRRSINIGVILVGVFLAAIFQQRLSMWSVTRPLPSLDPESHQVAAFDPASCTVTLSPGGNIQAELDGVVTGTPKVICLNPGTYPLTSTLFTSKHGPVTITGFDDSPVILPDGKPIRNPAYRAKTVLVGVSIGRVLAINHHGYTLANFSIEGQHQISDAQYTDGMSRALGQIGAWKDTMQSVVRDGRLIYVGTCASVGTGDCASGHYQDVTGFTLSQMHLRGAGGECVRIRNNASASVITDSLIEWCGMLKKGGRYHNGEALYYGTSPKSTTQPMYANDTTHGNIARDNVLSTYGSECFNAKEHAHDNTFINNLCQYNMDPDDGSAIPKDSSNVELRGHFNCVTQNTIEQTVGVNVKLKSDPGSDLTTGSPNLVFGNTITNTNGAVHAYTKAQTQMTVCGNTINGVAESACTTAQLASLPVDCPRAAPTSTPSPTVTTTPSITTTATLTPVACLGLFVVPLSCQLKKTQGDADCNGMVDLTDLATYVRIVSGYQPKSNTVDGQLYAEDADFSRDCETGLADRGILIRTLTL